MTKIPAIRLLDAFVSFENNNRQALKHMPDQKKVQLALQDSRKNFRDALLAMNPELDSIFDLSDAGFMSE